MRWILGLALCSLAYVRSAQDNSTYGFYREMGEALANGSAGAGEYFEVEGGRRALAGAGARRIFGGAATSLDDFPAACALVDRYFAERCSASVLSPHWALTAAHCVSNIIAYIKYNTRYSSSDQGDVVVVHYLYRHPEFRVLQEDTGKGLDVKLLHHDVGLVRTRDRIKLAFSLPPDPLAYIRRYDPMSLVNEEVLVLGFGRTEKMAQGEELCGARLRLTACGRPEWYHVVCGVGVVRHDGGGGGVCVGDSGGPVVFHGVQVAVTSMGPRECARFAPPGPDARSVFTSVRPYLDILNATMADTDKALTMRMIVNASTPPRPFLYFAVFAFLLRALLMQCRAC